MLAAQLKGCGSEAKKTKESGNKNSTIVEDEHQSDKSLMNNENKGTKEHGNDVEKTTKDILKTSEDSEKERQNNDLNVIDDLVAVLKACYANSGFDIEETENIKIIVDMEGVKCDKEEVSEEWGK